MAVSPDGGSSTRPKEPCFEKSSSSSDVVTPAGRFFARITVVLLGAAAWIQEDLICAEKDGQDKCTAEKM